MCKVDCDLWLMVHKATVSSWHENDSATFILAEQFIINELELVKVETWNYVFFFVINVL